LSKNSFITNSLISDLCMSLPVVVQYFFLKVFISLSVDYFSTHRIVKNAQNAEKWGVSPLKLSDHMWTYIFSSQLLLPEINCYLSLKKSLL